MITKVRKRFDELNITGFIIPSNDEFMSEYVPEHAKRLECVTGFTGSAGVAIILDRKAAFFTDGRYVLQAKQQLNLRDFKIFNIADKTPVQWLLEQQDDSVDMIIGFDPWLHTVDKVKDYKASGIHMRAVEENPVDNTWFDRPKYAIQPIFTHDVKYSGQPYGEKRDKVTDLLNEYDCDFMIITAPDSLCWLLNIRGNDVPCSPLVNAFAIHASSGETLLFIDGKKVPQDVVDAMDDMVVMIDTKGETAATIQTFLSNCADEEEEDYCFMFDQAQAPYWFNNELKSYGLKSQHVSDPIQLMKACKNEAEIEGAHQAHLQDGKAVVRFLHWFDQQIEQGADITERSAIAKLAEFRSDGKLYCEPSFETISGYGSNGAIIHYKVTEKTNLKIEEGSLYLVDSGGQYLNGTTDVTRTIPVGTPSANAVLHFTLVLKGHLALAMTSFPEGTTGSQLDVLARQYLWNHYLDYDHGTGHGVGSFLSVHEGPQRISKSPSHVQLQEGMIVSNEPGVYLENEYGIRIENLIMVMKKKNGGKFHKSFYGFIPLTLVPIDRRLIDPQLLTEQELKGLNAYHALVQEELTSLLDGDEEVLKWLEEKCAPIVKGAEIVSIPEPEQKKRRNNSNRNPRYKRRSRTSKNYNQDKSSNSDSSDNGSDDAQNANS